MDPKHQLDCSNKSDKSDRSDRSDLSDNADDVHPLLPPHGGYRKLRSYQTAELIYDATVIFCDRFVDRRSRTHDQMVQAARSGVRNIGEGSLAAGTSRKIEIKLTNVARASLGELLDDYAAFLRQRRLRQWPKDGPEALAVRHGYHAHQSDRSDGSDIPYDPYGIAEASPEVAANTLICLINQASYLLGRQLQAMERQFLEEGGFTERLYAARVRSRAEASGNAHASDKSDVTDLSDQASAPACPQCGKTMVQRTARKGSRAGQPFWGCCGYPDCTGTRPVQ